jgi:Ca-activated chloride channel family protein
MNKRGFTLAACVSLCLLCALAHGLVGARARQTREGRREETRPGARQDAKRGAGEDDEAISVEADLVNLHVRVSDAAGRAVADARREEFRVFEDGVEQEIRFFSREEVSVNYGLIFANTRSLAGHVGEVIGAAKTIIEGSRAGDEFFLARFEPRAGVSVKWDFTTDRAALFAMLDGLRAESGRAALRDAIYLSASYVAGDGPGESASPAGARLPRRRALIVLADGVDRASRYKDEELAVRLAAEGVQVYAVGFLGAGDGASAEDDKGGRAGRRERAGRRDRARALLSRLAEETGGRAFFPASFAELPAVAREIAVNLRTQYVVGYTPRNRARDGAFRSVRVAVAGGDGPRAAATRAGYFAPRPRAVR